MSVSSSAGSALCCSLATRIASCAAASRPAGSAKCVGSGAITDETRLPWVPCCSSVRMDTGTAASSGPVGQRIVFLQPGAQRAGAQRHHDVVDGDAGGVLDRLDLREREAGERPTPVRTECSC